MTIILLSIIAVLLLARIVLQIRQGKRAVEKGYATASEVETTVRLTNTDHFEVNEFVARMALHKWELVTVFQTTVNNNPAYALFFTRKKIKNYYEE